MDVSVAAPAVSAAEAWAFRGRYGRRTTRGMNGTPYARLASASLPGAWPQPNCSTSCHEWLWSCFHSVFRLSSMSDAAGRSPSPVRPFVAKCRPAAVAGIDPSEGFLATARARLQGLATFHAANALDIPFPSSSLDVVVSGLVLNFIPDASLGLVEMKRVARPGATIAAYVWDYAGRMQLMRCFWDAAVELNPAARDLDEGVRFPLCQPPALAAAFEKAALVDVEVTPIEVRRLAFATSMITGAHSSADRGRRHRMRCRWTKRHGLDCASDSASGCPRNPMAPLHL